MNPSKGTKWSLQPAARIDIAESGTVRMKQLSPYTQCSPDDAHKDCKMIELLRPAVLCCSDSLGVDWLGAWSHSVRPGSRPEASLRWRAHAYR